MIDAELTTATEAAVLLAVFLLSHQIQTLNVAGPRASGQPGIYPFVSDTLKRLLATKRRKRTRRN